MDAACTGCGEEVEARFRFCPWCGAVQRRKLVEFFWPHPNSAGRALRVSRYLGDDPQVRFSVWDDGVARAAVSLGEDEARRLAEFLCRNESGARHRVRDRGDALARCRRRFAFLLVSCELGWLSRKPTAVG